jgi:hypothetical protein
MVCFQTKNPNLGKFCWVLQWKMLVHLVHLVHFTVFWLYFMDIWYSSWKFGIFIPFWYFVRRKIWQRWQRVQELSGLTEIIFKTGIGQI